MGDILAIVTGSQDENEIILHTVLQAFCEALNINLRCAPLDRHAADVRRFRTLRNWCDCSCNLVAPVCGRHGSGAVLLRTTYNNAYWAPAGSTMPHQGLCLLCAIPGRNTPCPESKMQDADCPGGLEVSVQVCAPVLLYTSVFFCRGAVEKKSVLENLDLVLITLDETVDAGSFSPSPL
jgi:hypothetical protein